MDNWLEVRNLSFAYKEQVVFENASIVIPVKHRVVAVVGPSGAGKTTLLNLIAGFLPVNGGSLRIFDKAPGRDSANTPMVFQDHNLFPWKSVYGNVEFGLKVQGQDRQTRRAAVQGLMNSMGLGDKLHSYPRDLSGGMRQRVGLARALAIKPDCILMDEPFSATDHKTRDRVVEYFLDCLDQFGSNAIIVTHDLAEAAGVASCVVSISGSGQLQLIEFDYRPWGEARKDPDEIAARVNMITQSAAPEDDTPD